MIAKLWDIYSFLFCRKVFYRLNRFLFKLSLRGMGCDNYKNLYQSGEKNFIEKYIVPLKTPVCFDVGANSGEFSKLLTELIPEAEIHVFEPHPKTFNIAKSALQSFTNIKLNQLALSNKSGTVKLWDYDLDQNHSGTSHASLRKDALLQADAEKIIEMEVKTSTIDAYMEENNIEKIDFLKIDVEGHELEVLNGAENSIKQKKVNIIQFEFTQANPSCGIFAKQYFDLLGEDFNIYRILRDDIILLPEYNPTYVELMIYQNFVAIIKNEKI